VTFRTFFRQTAPRDDGFALIEVVISAFLVALIVVATLTGFDAAGRATADERFHSEAALLASKSQEALRSDAANALDTIQETGHKYTETVGGETFTISQKAKFVNGANGGATCAAAGGEESTESGRYVQITSSVTWPQLEASKRPALTQTSIITPPDGSSLEVDVNNGAEPPEAVPGVTVVLNKEVQTTTGTGGCVIYGSIPATSANIEASKTGYVTPGGASKVAVNEVSIAPNLTTHYPVELAAAGSIIGEFTYKGSPVEGDTFVAYNEKMGTASTFEVGGTPSTLASKTFAKEAKTASDLFPFPTAWAVYAGDCTANDPETVTKAVIKAESVTVEEGLPKTVKVPLSLLTLNVYSGSKPSSAGKAESGPYPVKITNTLCKSAIPNNATAAHYIHEQEFKSATLEHPYQPFGGFELCVYSSSSKSTYTLKYENTTVAGTALNVYLSGKSGENGVTINTGQTKC
jgi:type II secretory pathway pseudopilin PulG